MNLIALVRKNIINLQVHRFSNGTAILFLYQMSSAQKLCLNEQIFRKTYDVIHFSLQLRCRFPAANAREKSKYYLFFVDWKLVNRPIIKAHYFTIWNFKSHKELQPFLKIKLSGIFLAPIYIVMAVQIIFHNFSKKRRFLHKHNTFFFIQDTGKGN